MFLFTEVIKELAAEGYFTRLEVKFMHKVKIKKVPEEKRIPVTVTKN